MKQPKPFFRKQTQCWYVQLHGKQINLGKDKAEAYKQYHALVGGEQAAPNKLTVVELIDQFLANLKQTAKAERTYFWYRTPLESFRQSLEDRFNGRLRVFV